MKAKLAFLYKPRDLREVGFRPDSPGGMGEYMVIEEKYVHRIPDDWSYEDGAWVETFSIGYFGIWGNGGYIDASDTAIVLGAGPVGLSAAMVAKTSGALTIVVEPLKVRRDFALKYGADVVFDPTMEDVKDEIVKLTDGKGGSVVVEASGKDQAIASIFDIAGHSARVRLIGHSVGRKIPVELGSTIWKTLDITGSGGTRNFGQRTIRFMSRIRDRYDFSDLNTHCFPFERIHESFEFATDNKADALKVMLTF
jgi:L-iditol 2-dehydrogenase